MTASPPVLTGVAALRVRTVSDWHIGAGHGIPGQVNAVVRRDSDGAPYVPGTSLTGILRDACRVVATGLDDGTVGGVWHRWHTYLFGANPTAAPDTAQRVIRPAVVGIGAARMSAPLRSRLRSAELLDAAVIRRVGVAIDPDTGRAKDQALRFLEVARGGVNLHTELVVDPVPAEGEERIAATALLVLGMAWCGQLGADRRRGLGRVEISLAGHDPAAWAHWLTESGWTPPEPPAVVPAPTATVVPAGAVAGQRWATAELVFTTTGPVRVPSQVAGNIVRGLDYLPGSLLLPWLSQRWGGEVVRAAIWEQALIVRHALPEVSGGRGVPVPLTMFRSRDGDQRDLALGDTPAGWRQVRGAYTDATLTGGEIAVLAGALARVSHNAIDETTQRPTGETGVFELEVIPAGTRLHGRILIREDFLHGVADPWARLAGPARLGARRRGEYGAVTVDVHPATVAPVPAVGETATMWAVSDLVVRGPGLRLSGHPRDAVTAIAAQLGVAVELVSVTARSRRRDGWQGSWQLPRESIVGLAAGTVLTLAFPDGPPDPQRWAELVTGGVGERLAEGHGEVLADPALLRATTARVAAPTATTAAATRAAEAGEAVLDETDQAAFTVIAAAVTAARVRDALPEARADAEHAALVTAMGRLSRSQRGTWRASAVAAATAGALAPVIARIEQATRSNLERRKAERVAALVVATLIGRQRGASLRSWWDVLAAHSITVETDRDRAAAFAALLADVLDHLRRQEQQ